MRLCVQPGDQVTGSSGGCSPNSFTHAAFFIPASQISGDRSEQQPKTPVQSSLHLCCCCGRIYSSVRQDRRRRRRWRSMRRWVGRCRDGCITLTPSYLRQPQVSASFTVADAEPGSLRPSSPEVIISRGRSELLTLQMMCARPPARSAQSVRSVHTQAGRSSSPAQVAASLPVAGETRSGDSELARHISQRPVDVATHAGCLSADVISDRVEQVYFHVAHSLTCPGRPLPPPQTPW